MLLQTFEFAKEEGRTNTAHVQKNIKHTQRNIEISINQWWWRSPKLMNVSNKITHMHIRRSPTLFIMSLFIP